MGKYFLGVDQGTTGVTALLFDTDWQPVARGYRELRQIYPRNGWVEHDANDIWTCVQQAVAEALAAADAAPGDVIAIGLDHEGESVVLWDQVTGQPLYNTIVWQDRRTASDAQALAREHGDWIRTRTGLTPDAYFSATKLRWLMDHAPQAEPLLAQGRLLAGTMDTWLVWNMTGGRLHITDASTASRTMLMNLEQGDWDPQVLELLGLPRSILPTICDSAQPFGRSDPSRLCGIRAPISGILADQQAALFGQACVEPGMVKTTYGTGCFMLMNTGAVPVFSSNGLLTTVGWRLNGTTTYALDGGIYISGAATQWLRDGLKIISSAAQTQSMALSVQDNGGVYFVPAFTGLAAPYWDSYARGMMIGITGATTREHIVRATLESTAYQVCDLLTTMQQDSGVSIPHMRCDGGAANNQFLMQFQADLLGIPLSVPRCTDTTALGAACMAAVGAGILSSPAELADRLSLARTYEPQISADRREGLLYDWHRAVERARSWARG